MHYHTWLDGHVYPGEEERSQFGSNPDLAAGNWWGHQKRDQYDMVSEGDSPSFLYLIDKGLRTLEDPTFGGWSGRFMRVADNDFNPAADYWCTAPDACEPPMMPEALQLTRWIADWMMDFASRASWCVAERYEDGNHAPQVSVAEGLDLTAAPGTDITLHAVATDPDGDDVSLSWLRYADADTCAGDDAFEAEGVACTVRIPAEAESGSTIHIICRANDEGNGRYEYMVNYARQSSP